MEKQRKTIKTCIVSLTLIASAAVYAGSYQLRTGVGYKNPSGGTLSYTNVSVPYSGGYGGSASDNSFVTCTGAITTVYDWVPSTIPNPAPGALTDNNPNNDTIPDPLDTPPVEVISKETCTASYGGHFFIDPGGSGSGSCDNGLGFDSDDHYDPIYIYSIDFETGEITQELVGYSFSGISKGTLYKKRSGGATITLTCSPSAQATVVNGSCSASVSYQSSIIVPTVDLLGTTRFYSPNSIKFITGQRINSTVSIGGSGGGGVVVGGPVGGGGSIGFGIDPTSYQWSFDGGNIDPFKDYTYGSVGEKKLLLTADYKQSAFNFYSLRGASTKVVCDFKFTLPPESKFAGGLPDFQAKSKEVESVRPEYKSWDVKDGTSTLYSDRIEFALDADSTNGQQWLNVKYELPAPFTQVGQGSFCQLINANRNLYRTVTAPGNFTHYIKDPWNAVQAIDMGMPYPFGTTWNISGLGSGVDSPVQPLSLALPNTGVWYESSAVDSFETWAMYRPPASGGQPTTYVPMAKYTWAWSGKATWTLAGGTVFSNNSGGKTSTPAESYVHPTWTKTSPSPFSFKGVP